MPMKINDSGLSTLYSKLASTPNAKIDLTQALNVLAQVGDRSGWSSSSVLKELQKPGMTQQAQIDLVKKGMSASEKADLIQILDKGTVPLDPAARTFLEGVVGRSGPTPPPPPPAGDGTLKVTGSQAGGISGTAKAGDTIEAINLSAAPAGRLHLEDTMVIGKADNTGHFANTKLTGDQAVQEGDLIRMRARHSDGTAGDWVTVKATGVASSDTRNAVVALFRVGMTDAGAGKIALANINDGRQISEPGAVLQFTNVRTGEKTKVTINDQGTFAAGVTVPGKAGDVFSIAATDGKNNTSFSAEVGKLTVPGGAPADGDLIKDPALDKDDLNTDGTPKYSTHRFTGPLFKDGPKPTDVQQGQLGDCFFPSGMAALAQNNSEAIQKLIKDNGDGTYTVNFKEKDWATGKYKDVPIKVDGDLYVRSWGGPLYGAALGADKGEKTMELWFPLVEKAYATWKGSYNDMGSGGMSSDVFQAVLGKDGQDMSISYASADKVFAQIKTAIDNKQPVSAGTYGDDKDAMYTNTGVYADHSYSVLGYKEKDGEKYVTLRNPWGESEPAGNGANDGIFDMKLADFTKLYQTLMYTNP